VGAPFEAVPVGTEAATLQSRLEHPAEVREGEPPTITDPVGLFRRLESDGRFHRDTGLGRLFHPGRLGLRENSRADSLHVVIDGNRIAAHVDRVSPLGLRPSGRSRYSVRQAAAHNLAGMSQDLGRLLRGRQGDHRGELHCEWLWRPAADLSEHGGLLDPTAAAWSVHLEARVAGTLDEARLRTALSGVLRRWEMEHDPLEVVECHDESGIDAARARLHRLVVPVSEWPPLRACLARHPDGDVLMLNLNHAAVDGFGAMGVLDRIARAYATGTEAEPPLDFLAFHDLPVRPASAPLSVWGRVQRSLTERLRDQLARPARLAPAPGRDEPGYGFHLVRLSAEDTTSAVDVTRPGTSRNVLMAALHLAVGDWNLEHASPGRQIGVLVPVNLRPPDWPDDVVGNFSVTARISTSRRHRSGPAAALEAVTAQTTRNRRTRTGTALLAALRRAGLLPLWAKQSLVVLQPLTRHGLVDTAMLANLGPVADPPWFGPEAGETADVWFSLPARAPQALCVGAVTVGGRLHLTFRYPHRLFDREAAARFAACYVAQIRSVAASRASREGSS
jgi:NRPS condensation-like uncharacterized protein